MRRLSLSASAVKSINSILNADAEGLRYQDSHRDLQRKIVGQSSNRIILSVAFMLIFADIPMPSGTNSAHIDSLVLLRRNSC